MTSFLTLAVILALWAGFAPPSLGGSTSYVVTDGISMEPRFHTGDLALVRSESDYRVGQIVAYYSKVFHTVVLHRIIAMDGNRYVFKGDNNNFIDFEHPARSQLIGALWIHLPGWGKRLQSLHSPALIGLLIGLGALLMMGTVFVKRGRRRLRRRRAQQGGAHGQANPLAQMWAARDNGAVLAVLIGGLVALAPFVVLALLAFTRPSSALSPVSLPYTQSGRLSYSARAEPGPAYASDRASTGDPLFTRVLKDIEVSYGYRLSAHAARSLAGRATLTAQLSSTSGWQATIPLGGPGYFRGDSATVRGTLDVTALEGLLAEVQSQTGVTGTYTLTVLPQITIGGSLGQVPLHTNFTPSIPFTLNSTEIRPVMPQSAGTKAPDPFVSSAAGSASGRSYQPTYLSLRMARLSVSDARLIAMAAILLIACAMGLGLAVALARPRRSESSVIASRLGSAIVPVAKVHQQPGVPVIDVEDIDALARIAEHYDRSILQEHTDGGEAFWVTDESGQFRYRAGDSEPARERIARARPEPALEPVPEAQPSHAQPSYAQPSYAQPSYAQPSYAQPTAVQPVAVPVPEPESAAEPQPAAWPTAGEVAPEVDRRSGALALRWAEPSTLTHRPTPAL